MRKAQAWIMKKAKISKQTQHHCKHYARSSRGGASSSLPSTLSGALSSNCGPNVSHKTHANYISKQAMFNKEEKQKKKKKQQAEEN